MKKIFNILITISLILTLSGCSTNNKNTVEKEVVNKADYTLNVDNFTVNINNFKKVIDEDYRPYTNPFSKGSLEDYLINNFKHEASSEKLEFRDVLKDINDSKEELASKTKEFWDHDYTYYYGTSEDRKGKYPPLKDSELSMLKERKQAKKKLRKKDLLEEAKLIDRYLRTKYGPFKIIGKENFDHAHEELTKRLNELEDTISFEDYVLLIKDVYGFIMDQHMMLEDYPPRDAFRLMNIGFYYDDFYFLKDDKGYYLKDFSPKAYLTSVDGHTKLDDYMHYSIEPSGELAYMISYSDQIKKKGSSIKIILDNKEFEITPKEMLGPKEYQGYGSQAYIKDIESFTGVEGFPVIAERLYYERENIHPNFKRYMNFGNILKEEPVVIHDTRSNGGGSDEYMGPFFSNLTGIKEADSRFYNNEYNCKKVNVWGRDMPVIIPPRKEVVKGYNNLLFTLTDHNSGSCGDQVAINTKFIENAILVGEPTKGCIMGGNREDVWFKSGLFLGASLQVMAMAGEDHLPDGKGIIPDIWLASDEAVDKTTAMLKYYDIKPGTNTSEIINKHQFGTNDSFRVNLNDLVKNQEERLNKFQDITTSYRVEVEPFIEYKYICFNKNYINNKTKKIEKTIREKERLYLVEGNYSLGDYEVEIIDNSK